MERAFASSILTAGLARYTRAGERGAIDAASGWWRQGGYRVGRGKGGCGILGSIILGIYREDKEGSLLGFEGDSVYKT